MPVSGSIIDGDAPKEDSGLWYCFRSGSVRRVKPGQEFVTRGSSHKKITDFFALEKQA
jgi:hypothetical protein